MVRFGIAGVGWWAREVHIPNLNRAGNAAIAALCSRSQENLKAGEALCEGQVMLFRDFDAMLGCEEVDAVVICTPNALHARQAIAALRAGKHVLCEKPMALSRQDALEVTRAVEQTGRVFAIGMELRCADVSVAARAAIEEGRIGVPQMATGRFWRPWGAMHSGWRGQPDLSGGVFAELFCHAADLQACLLGEPPASVWASASAVHGPPYWDHAAAAFQYPSGAVGSVNLCLLAWGTGQEYPFEVVGDEGRLVGELITGTLQLWPREADGPEELSPQRPPGGEIHGFPGSLEMVEEFAACVEGRPRHPRAGHEVGLAAVETTLAIEESVHTGRRVELHAS